jgi:hypothetical protein
VVMGAEMYVNKLFLWGLLSNFRGLDLIVTSILFWSSETVSIRKIYFCRVIVAIIHTSVRQIHFFIFWNMFKNTKLLNRLQWHVTCLTNFLL